MASEPPDPPRKNYDFKERAFQRDNAPASGLPSLPTAKELAMMAGPGAPTAKNTNTPKAGDPNDVFAVRQANRAAEEKLGLNAVVLKTVRSRRRRDYWVILLASEAALAVTAVLGRGNPFVLACAVAGMGLVAFGLTWIMWQVMNKY